MNIQSVMMKSLARLLFGRFNRQDIPTQRAMMEKYAFKPRGVAFQPVRAGGVPAEWITPPNASPDRVLLHLHGGAYVLGSIATHRSVVARLAKASKRRALLIDYRLAPEHPFPAALEDAKIAYDWLLQGGYSPTNLAISGDSAGGGLALAALVALRDAGEPLPAAVALISPWTDLVCNSESFHNRAHLDPILFPETVSHNAGLYAGKYALTHPLISPLYANLSALPPILIQVGTDEILYDDSTGLAKGIQSAGGQATLEVWDGMIHVFQLFADLMPVSRRAITHIGAFLN